MYYTLDWYKDSDPEEDRKHREVDADVFYRLLQDDTLGPTLAYIKGAARLIEEARSDEGYQQRLIDGNFSDEDFEKYHGPILEFLQRHLTPPNYKGSSPTLAQWFLQCNFEFGDENLYSAAEDFYKFRDDLALFERWRNTKAASPNDKNDYADCTNFSSFEEFAPAVARAQKYFEKDRALRAQYKKSAQSDYTVIYDGPAGKIVVPHTSEACQNWGSGTRWCISARQASDNRFPSYNCRAPIFILLPKVTEQEREQYSQLKSFKFAITNGSGYDELDNASDEYEQKNSVIAPCVERLHVEALGTLKGGQLKYYELMTQTGKVYTEQKKEILNRFSLPSDIPEEWRDKLTNLQNYGTQQVDLKALENNGEFMLLAIAIDPRAFQNSSRTLRGFPPFQEAAIRRNPLSFGYLPPTAQAERHDLFIEVITSAKPNVKEQIFRTIHLLPEFFGGPLTADAEEIMERLGRVEVSEDTQQTPDNPSSHLMP